MTEQNEERAGRPRRRFSVTGFVLWLGLYLDDLLFVAAGICFTAAAGLSFGCNAALAVSGACCLGYGIVVARARNRGDER